MKRNFHYTLFLILFISNYRFTSGQNMVPNPSFEDLKSSPPCWTSGSREDFPSYVEEWIIPNMGTTDLLSTLAPSDCITAMPLSTASPVNYFPGGSQIPRTGNNFAGIKPLNDYRREYLEVKLNCPLIPGEEYYAEMYVSLSEHTNYAQNELGMYFSDTLVFTETFDRLNFTPQIVENNIIADSINWVKISGTFTATTPAKYLIIGSFATQANTTTLFLGNKGDIDFPYYFIDDITVRKVNPPPILITGDTIVCQGDTVSLITSGWTSVKWTIPASHTVISNTNNLVFVPSQSSTITAQTKFCNSNLNRNVTITITPNPEINIGKDTMICPGDFLTLNADPNLNNYQWSNGVTNQYFTTVSLPGVYWVTAKNNEGCQGKDEITLAYYKTPKVNLGDDLFTCTSEGILDAESGQTYDTYQWMDNSTSPQLFYSSPGVYWVKVTNVCNEEDTDSLTVIKIDPFIPNLITPNGDEKNDYFEILDIENGKGKLSIYNREGSAIYTNERYMNDFSGGFLSEGIYFYSFIYPTCPDRKGWIHILK